MKLAINQILSAAITIVWLAVACVLFISIRQSQRVRDITQFVHYTEQVIQESQKVILSVQDNENGARRYVITGNGQFLKSVEAKNVDAFISLQGNNTYR